MVTPTDWLEVSAIGPLRASLDSRTNRMAACVQVAAFTADQVAALTPEQLKAMPPELMAALTESQLAVRYWP